jgi:hypothetical protein
LQTLLLLQPRLVGGKHEPQSEEQEVHVSPCSQIWLPHCGWQACGGLQLGVQEPQSEEQDEHVSPASQTPLPHGGGGGQMPQSASQVEQLSPA